LTELLLFAAARTELVHTIIRPALINPLNCVICDRFTASTVAYQGYGRGLELSLIHKLNQSATGGLKPDWTILLDLDVKTSIDRRRKAGDVNRFDTEKVAFLDRVRDGYLMQVIQNEDRYFVLDAMRSLADLRQDIFSFVSAKLRENSEGRR
jgi:dTMP kinase